MKERKCHFLLAARSRYAEEEQEGEEQEEEFRGGFVGHHESDLNSLGRFATGTQYRIFGDVI